MVILIFLLIPGLSLCGNILFLNTWHSKSHGRTMMYLAETLVRRGHNVTMYSQVAAPLGSMGKGVTTLESRLPEGTMFGSPAMVSEIFWKYEMSPLKFEEPQEISYQYLEALRHDETLEKVLETPFDIALVDEMFLPAQGAIALKLQEAHGTSIGFFSTTDLFAYSANYGALSRNPATFASAYTKGYAVHNTVPERFYIRLMNTVDALVEHYVFNYQISHIYTNAGKLFDLEYTLPNLYEKSRLTLADYPIRYGSAIPRSLDYVSVSEHCEHSKELDNDLKMFVEDPKSKGTIYIAFGSVVNWNAGPPHVIETFANVFNRLKDYRVIWSYTGPELRNLEPHIRLLKWAPQNDILAHPRTVLFFTHGGLKSLREGVCSNTPLLFLPFFADQAKNAAYAIQMRLAEAIYKGNIEENELYGKMIKVLRSEKLKNSVARYAAHFKDNPIKSLDLGAFWIEKVLRHRDLPFTRIRGRDISWFDYLQSESLIFVFSLLYILS